MTTFAKSFAPPNALLMWTDGKAIFVELPTPHNKPPVIITFRLCEGGLSKALALLNSHADYSGLPEAKPPVPNRPKSEHTLAAERIFAKYGVLK